MDPVFQGVALPRVCVAYDEECLGMTQAEAMYCHLGFLDEAYGTAGGVSGPDGIGRACGTCPILGFQ